MKLPSHCSRTGQQGVSLIELMVGVVIGLLATLVIAQVASLYETQKRQIASSGDAQISGALALYALQRDIEMGGYGLTSGGVAGCTQISGKRIGDTTTRNWTLAPVIITQGGGATGTTTGRADTVRVLMANNNNGFALPMSLGENHRRDDTSFVLADRINVGNRQGDLLLVIPPAGVAGTASPSPAGQVGPNFCSLAQINTTPSGNILTHGTTNGPWNQDPSGTIFPGSLGSDIAYAAGSTLINLGTLTDRCYFISDPNETTAARRCDLAADSTEMAYTLRLRNFNTADATTTNQDIHPDIVNLQAVYGLDTTATPDGTVDSWTTTTPTTTAGWAQVIAVRVAVLSRTAQYDDNEVTNTAPAWRPDGVNSLNFTLPDCPTGQTTCWKHYRYRVFERVIPLRNMLWQARQS